MTHDDPPGGRNGLQRSRTDRVLGGVCAGIADRLDVDPMLVRVAAVAFALVSSGAAVVTYLIAWVVISNSTGRQPGRPAAMDTRPGDEGLRSTWSATGDELRSLATELRRPCPAPSPEPDTAQQEASRTAAIDAAITSLGDRLRDPEVHDRGRRSTAGLHTAVAASVDAVATRVRRDSPPAPDNERPTTPSPVDVADEVPPSWPTS
jgi:phage shock protein PspC (stress-responsive transcriptional regulator)